MREVGEPVDVGDGCWRGRYDTPEAATRALRRSAEHRVDGRLKYYLDISGHDREGGLVYRIVPVLDVTAGCSKR